MGNKTHEIKLVTDDATIAGLQRRLSLKSMLQGLDPLDEFLTKLFTAIQDGKVEVALVAKRDFD